MDIFEQLDTAQIMLVNGQVTTNFGYCPDDPPEDWCLSIYGADPETHGSYEYYFDRETLKTAELRGDEWLIKNEDDDGYTKIEFCVLIGVEQYLKYEDEIPHY